MSIHVACPACGRQYTVKDDAAGKRFKCKDCQSTIDVPAAGAADEFAPDDYGEPYGEAEAPMAAPARRQSSGRRGGSASAAAAQTKLPAIFMYVVCGLSIAYVMLQLVGTAIGVLNPESNDSAYLVGYYSAFCVFIARDVFLIYAFSRMHVLRSYGMALTGAVISVIPLLGSPCCVLGLPFGIWALVVLNNPSVKSAFR